MSAPHPPCGCGCDRGEHRISYEFGRWVYTRCRVHAKCHRYTPATEPEPDAERAQLAPGPASIDEAPIVTPAADPAPEPEPVPAPELVPAGELPLPPGTVLFGYDAWQCRPCGSRYSHDDRGHGCGPLTPVRVTVATR